MWVYMGSQMALDRSNDDNLLCYRYGGMEYTKLVGGNMFIVEASTKEDLKLALDLIGEYRHATYKLSLTPPNNTFTLVVEENEELVEMAFQMNWHQKSIFMCPVCREEIERTGTGDACCGHLVFHKPIRAAF